MRKILLSLVFVLLVPAAASAAAPPAFEQTAQYKELVRYVDENLEPYQLAPVTPENRELLRDRLTTRSSAAKIRANNLYLQRKNYRENRVENSRDRAVLKVRRTYRKVFNKIAKVRKTKLHRLKREYKDDLLVLDRALADSSQGLKTRLADLRDEYSKARRAARKTALENEINGVIKKLKTLQKEYDQDLVVLDIAYDEDRDAELLKAKRKVKKQKRYLSLAVQARRDHWHKVLRKAIFVYKEHRIEEHELVDDQHERGELYIDARPNA